MTTAADILKRIKDEDIKFLDVRFSDPKGKMHHVTMDVGIVDEDMFADGIMFDGSSIGGWYRSRKTLKSAGGLVSMKLRTNICNPAPIEFRFEFPNW